MNKMLRKCSAMCAAMVALVALMLVSGGRANASAGSQSLYVNAQLASSVPTYIWVNAYQYQGQVGGDFYIGDLEGINFAHGFPTSMSFPSPSQAHLEGVALYNGQLATFSIDFNGDTSVSFNIKTNGQTAWSSGITPAGADAGMSYAWAGVYMFP
jgi:hypothetical protein